MVTKTIKIAGRNPDRERINVGNEFDNNSEHIKFVLPERWSGAAVFLHLSNGTYADVVLLGDDRIYTPTRTHTQHPGQWTAYLEAQMDGDVVWHSDTFKMVIGDLPDDGEQIEQAYPTAIETALKAVDTLTGVKARAVTLTPKNGATVEFEEDANGIRTIVYGIPQGVTFTPYLATYSVLETGEQWIEINWQNNGGLENPPPRTVRAPASVGIASVDQTVTSTAPGGVNVITVTLTSGDSYDFEVRNGAGGSGDGNGEPGEDGGYYVPSVSAAGDLTWAPSKADMPDVETINIKGPQGDPGEVTAESITSALGYTPADTEKVNELSEEIVNSYALDGTNAIEIPANSNLDTYLTVGNFKIQTQEVATTVTNIPIEIGGRLTVLSTTQNNRLVQRYEANSIPIRTYSRFYNGSSWSEWCKLANEKDLEKYYTLTAPEAISVPSGANLNDYLEEGNYRISSSTVANSLLNLPYAVAGRLTVMSTTMAGRYIQKFETNTTLTRIFMRFYDGTEWKGWNEIATKADFETSIKSTKILITPENYANYFTDFNDIPVNTIYNLADNVPLLNAPKGTTVIGYTTMDDNIPGGTILTYSGSVTNNKRDRFQLFTGATSTIPQSIIWFRSAFTVDDVLKWSEWQRLSEVSAVTSTNIVLSKEHAHNFFTDLNDAPINTIYQIDLNCEEGVLANHPMPGVSCVLVTLGFSFTSRHGMVQMCFGLKDGCSFYFRYGFRQSSDEYRWTAWKKTLTE